MIIHSQNPDEKRSNYATNIVYATNNELGFDYLRDNMVSSTEKRVMGPLYFALVDEVDSILVDEARTPLIISAPDSEPTSKYLKFAAIAKSLTEGTHYKIDEKQKTATLVEAGITELERILGVENIYASDNYNDIHHIENAIKAQFVYRSDVDYLVRGQEVLIIDEHTGRVLSGRRYSDGLHQAIEAKERVEIQQETRTLASITFQNYFRLYKRLAGMTGTAKTEEEEFYKIYRLEVITVPTNRPMIRQDQADLLFKNETGKYTYLVKLLGALQEKGQPVLVGTVSVAKSEYLSDLLTKAGVAHKVLNAKQDANEAEIISQAGTFGAITIATNMAGRGTDIKISPEVAALTGVVEIPSISDSTSSQKYPLGGLFVIGTEKHETRRIDNQLRGRSGRQGDPGLSQFLVAPTDDIMRIFGGDKLFGIFNSPMFASIPEEEPLAQSKILTSRITGVQKQVEGRNFDVRKHILEYDDVLNQHRLVAYGRRNRLLEGTDPHEGVVSSFTHIAEYLIERAQNTETEDFGNALITEVNTFAETDVLNAEDLSTLDPEDLVGIVATALLTRVEGVIHSSKEAEFRDFERRLQLSSIDELWMAHIDRMAHLREEVAFEGYAQKQPLVVYKERAYERFGELMHDIDFKIVKTLLTIESIVPIREHEVPVASMIIGPAPTSLPEDNPLLNTGVRDTSGIRVMKAAPAQESTIKYTGVGRNDLCPCGSGKKFKHCHGK